MCAPTEEARFVQPTKEGRCACTSRGSKVYVLEKGARCVRQQRKQGASSSRDLKVRSQERARCVL